MLLKKPCPNLGPQNTRNLRLKNTQWEPKHNKDGVSKESHMIYSNHFSLYLFSSYFFTTVVAFVCAGTMLVKLYEYKSELPGDVFDSESEVLHNLFLASVGIILACMIKVLCSRTLLRIYYNKTMDSFIGVSMNWRLQKQLFYFRKQDLKFRPTEGKVFGEMYGNVSILGKYYTLQERDFRNAKYYYMLVGSLQ